MAISFEEFDDLLDRYDAEPFPSRRQRLGEYATRISICIETKYQNIRESLQLVREAGIREIGREAIKPGSEFSIGFLGSYGPGAKNAPLLLALGIGTLAQSLHIVEMRQDGPSSMINTENDLSDYEIDQFAGDGDGLDDLTTT